MMIDIQALLPGRCAWLALLLGILGGRVFTVQAERRFDRIRRDHFVLPQPEQVGQRLAAWGLGTGRLRSGCLRSGCLRSGCGRGRLRDRCALEYLRRRQFDGGLVKGGFGARSAAPLPQSRSRDATGPGVSVPRSGKPDSVFPQ